MLRIFTQNLAPLAATIAPLALPAPEAITLVTGMGYRAIQWSATTEGMRPRDLDSSSRRGLAAHLRRLGSACSGIDLFIPSQHFAQTASVDRAIDAVTQAVSLSTVLGRCPVSLSLPQETPEIATTLREAREAIESIASKEGVRLADHGVGATCASAGATIGVGIDPPAQLSAGINPVDAVAKAGSALLSARVCDLLATGMRGPAGETHEARLDLTAYAAALAVIPLTSSPVADARQWTDPAGGLEAMLKRWYEEVPA